jgi:RNA-binding protein YhbY
MLSICYHFQSQPQRLQISLRDFPMQNNIRTNGILVLSLLLSLAISAVDSFSIQTPSICTRATTQKSTTSALCSSDSDDDAFVLEETDTVPVKKLDYMEKTWRYAKKPLLRIGSKGATATHGNSLRQLLEDHTVCKVKINTNKCGSLQEAFDILRKLAEEAGASENIELIQARDGDKIILFGLPGTLERINKGEFPPPPPPPYIPPESSNE